MSHLGRALKIFQGNVFVIIQNRLQNKRKKYFFMYKKNVLIKNNL